MIIDHLRRSCRSLAAKALVAALHLTKLLPDLRGRCTNSPLFLFLFLSASYFLFSREVCGLRLDSVLLDLDADSDWFSGPDVHMCLC